jgi:site-specific DNA recombinase
LNDRGDDSPERELTDGILDQLAKYEPLKTAERTRRSKLKKAREGKILATRMPNYGFDFNDARDRYAVNEEKMAVVRRIFRMVGTEGASIGKVKKTLHWEGITTPASGASWSRVMLRQFILNDVHQPHSVGELEDIVVPEVAARLDRNKLYGVWWYSRRHVTERRVRENGGYKRRTKSLWKPRNEWIGVPMPDAGISRELVDAAREVIRNARSRRGRRRSRRPTASGPVTRR